MTEILKLAQITPTLAFFFFNDTATTEIYTLSLHDALPICTDVLRPLEVCRADHRHPFPGSRAVRSEEHTSELQSQSNLVCRLLLEKKNNCYRCHAAHDGVHVTHYSDPADTNSTLIADTVHM